MLPVLKRPAQNGQKVNEEEELVNNKSEMSINNEEREKAHTPECNMETDYIGEEPQGEEMGHLDEEVEHELEAPTSNKEMEKIHTPECNTETGWMEADLLPENKVSSEEEDVKLGRGMRKKFPRKMF